MNIQSCICMKPDRAVQISIFIRKEFSFNRFDIGHDRFYKASPIFLSNKMEIFQTIGLATGFWLYPVLAFAQSALN